MATKEVDVNIIDLGGIGKNLIVDTVGKPEAKSSSEAATRQIQQVQEATEPTLTPKNISDEAPTQKYDKGGKAVITQQDYTLAGTAGDAEVEVNEVQAKIWMRILLHKTFLMWPSKEICPLDILSK